MMGMASAIIGFLLFIPTSPLVAALALPVRLNVIPHRAQLSRKGEVDKAGRKSRPELFQRILQKDIERYCNLSTNIYVS